MFLILATGLNRPKSGVSFCETEAELGDEQVDAERQENGESSDDRERNERTLEQCGGDAGKGGDAQVGVKRLGQGAPQHGLHGAHPAWEPGEGDDDEHDELGGGHQLARGGELSLVAGFMEPPR